MRPAAKLEHCLAAAGAWELVDNVECSRRVSCIVQENRECVSERL